MKKGFTLIELLVVVLIIAILAAVALPQYTKAVEKSRATEALVNGKAIRGAIDRYVLANDAAPTDLAQLDVLPTGCTGGASCTVGKFSYVLMNGDTIFIDRVGGLYSLEMNSVDGKIWCLTGTTNTKGMDFCSSISGKSVDHASASNSYFSIN
ncbi:prepilin-type N-terminal cleavage/methylation domain-containing protein [Parelusimicrobium proximum]|uniref:type IV pilin protein n=1 Tax=Parelusimicrobium proximum TaxID=3228953 RepID=UPI003D17F0AD